MRAGGGRARPWVWLVVAALAGGAGVVCSAGVAAGDIIATRWPLLEVIGAWWVAFAIGVAALLHAPRRAGLVVVVLVALALRAAALTGGPALSDDLYRYAWDSRVQAAGIDPYRHPPLDAQLTGLRDSWLWPTPAGCAAIDRVPGCTRIGRPAARTIYPPVAELWFLAVHIVAPQAHESAWRAAGLAVELALLAVLLAVLRGLGRDPRWAALYAWSPVAVIETVQNGHVDGLAALLAVIAVWAARRRPARSAALVAAATLVKLYPAALLPMLLGRGRQAIRPVAILLGLVAVAYLPHVLAVGVKVLGYLPGYLQEEHYAGGGRFQLLALVGVQGVVAQGVAVVLILAVVVWVLRTRGLDRIPEVAARRVLGGLLLIATPVQPWYALPLLAVAALDGAWWWAAPAAAAYPLYFSEVLNGPSNFAGRLGYAVAALVVLAGALTARRRTKDRSGWLASAPHPAG